MTVSYDYVIGTFPGDASRGILVRGQRVEGFWHISSDNSIGMADVITMADMLTGMAAADATQTDLQEILPGFTYVLRAWALFSDHVTLDLRNTNLDISSRGAGVTQGAGIVFRAFGVNATDVLTGGARATLITGNTLIIGRNRDDEQRIYGPFNRNSRWQNRDGSTTIMIDGGPRYDWSCNETGTNDMTPQMFGLYDFEEGHRVGVVGVGALRGDAHLFVHPDSNPRGFEARDAMPGGVITAATTVPYTLFFFGGRFDNLVFGGLLTGPVQNKRSGLAAGDVGLTVEIRDARASSRTITVNRRESFFDILGVIGTQRESIVSATNSINAVAIQYVGASDSSRSAYRGLFRLAYQWRPRFIGTNGDALSHNHNTAHFNVILGTVTANDMPAAATDTDPPFMDAGDDFGAVLSTSAGTITWTDPWTRSRPETGRMDRVRDHIRLPWAWTQHMGHEQNLAYFTCNSATWQMYIAGYLPPNVATTLSYPFVGEEYGHNVNDIVVPFDAAFGDSAATVLTRRITAKADYGAGLNGDHDSLSLYRSVMYAIEDTTNTAAEAWAKHASIDPEFSGGMFRLKHAGSRMMFHDGTAIAIDNDERELTVPGGAVAGEQYGAGTYVHFNAAIPDCIVDTPRVIGTVSSSSPVNGLRILQNTSLELDLDDDQVVQINGITGATLTVKNAEGTGNISLVTDSGANITAGTRVTITIGIEVSGLTEGTSDDPALLYLYPMSGGVADVDNVLTASNEEDHVFSGLTAGNDYRFVWALAGHEPILHDFDAISAGVTRQTFVPQSASNAASTSDIPAAAIIAAAYDSVQNRAEYTIQSGVAGLNGEQTNALFERAKGLAAFMHVVARRNAINQILHPSLHETSLRNNNYHLFGAEAGVCAHVIQGVYEHRGTGLVIAGNRPDVETRTVTVAPGVNAALREVIVYPGTTNATIDAIGDIVSDAEDSIIAEIGDGGGGVVSGFTDDATDDLIEAAIIGGG